MHMEIQQTDQFRKWLHRLRDHAAKARITARIRQCGLTGQPVGDMHPVGKGVNELRFSSAQATASTSPRKAIKSCCCSPAGTKPDRIRP